MPTETTDAPLTEAEIAAHLAVCAALPPAPWGRLPQSPTRYVWALGAASAPLVCRTEDDAVGDAIAFARTHWPRALHTIQRLRRASRTRPDYNLRCQECGAPHWFDTSLPSAIWNQIAEPPDILCLLCIDARLAAKGLLTTEAEFYFCGDALTSKLYVESRGTVAYLEREVDRLTAERDDVIARSCRLVELLGPHIGETGKSEHLVETLERLIAEVKRGRAVTDEMRGNTQEQWAEIEAEEQLALLQQRKD